MKFATTYFRHSFEVTDAANFTCLRLQLWVDDGAAVYLNGKEVARDNLDLNAGNGDYSVQAVADNANFDHEIDVQSLRPGRNCLAVAVHQCTPDSSDLSFDLSLVATGVVSWMEHTDSEI